MKKDCSMEEVAELLKAPFPSQDIEWRVSRCGTSNGKSWAMVLAYVTNRAIQNRLDDVFGPGGWKNDYRDFMQGILCTISCYIDGEWVSKADGAEQTQFESLKGGLSAAMKRCGTQWGIGRYLYNLEESFVEVSNSKSPGSIYLNDKKQNVKGYWLPPQLPDWALPENERKGTKNHSNVQWNQNANKNTVPKPKQADSNVNNRTIDPNFKEENKRQAAVNVIIRFLTNTGLKEKPEWIIPLFMKVNPELKQSNIADVFREATEHELKLYYQVLKPVNDLVLVSNSQKVSINDTLRYVQILIPTIKVESIFSCFTHLKDEHVKDIIEFIKEDLKNGTLQKIA